MESVFWGAVFLIIYPYLVYPLLLAAWGVVRPRPVRKSDAELSVTVLIPAYNEADCIAATVQAMLAQDYPRDKLQIMVVSDGSDDGTDDIVRGFAAQGVQLLRQEGRGGKALALNAAVRQARGEIVVFCDANARFDSRAVRAMIRNFADPDVGYATGQLGFSAAEATVSGGGVSAYMRFETLLRRAETRVGSVIGVNGGIDAIRRDLYSDIPKELITDFVLPLRVIAAGRRVVFEPDARSTEEPNSEISSEYRMRVRVALRAWQGLAHMARLLNPLRYPGTAFCLMSHKLIRYLGFVFLVAAMLSNVALALHQPLYMALLVTHLLVYALAFVGMARLGGGVIRKITLVPAYLLMTYSAFAVAMFRFLRGQSMATWQPRAG